MNMRGFTLLEVLLSVSIITLLIGMSVPVYESVVRRNDLELAAQNVSSALRRAQTYARATKEDNTWSVHIQSSAVTLFKGTNFATRDTLDDETYSIPGSIAPGGLTEVQFANLTALPNTTGSIVLTSSTSSVKTVTINAKGMVNY